MSKSQIDLIYQDLLARHATLAEQDSFSALSSSVSVTQLQLDIITLPEATNIVDPIFRFYQGTFGRLPDTVDPDGNFDSGAQSGFWANVNAVRNGVSLLGLANAFVVSSEFHNLFGSTTLTPALITAFYHRILERDPSSAEVGAWVDTGLDAGDILFGFTQSAEFTARSQASMNQFKLDHCPLPPPPPEYSLVSDADLDGVDEGNAVTFTLQGPESSAGQTFSYIIRGINPEDIVGGQLVGSVTLDQHGTGYLTLTVADDHLIEGTEVFNIEFPGIPHLDRNVAINDAVMTELQFSSKIGETLAVSAGSDAFLSTADHTSASNTSTYSNVVDIDQDNGGFEALHLVVNQSNIDIVPNADVGHLLVTDRLGNGNNDVTTGNQNDVIRSGQNVIDADLGQDDITITLDSNVDTIDYNAAAKSLFSLPDIIGSFSADDILQLIDNDRAFHFPVVTIDAAVAEAIAGPNTDSHANIVFNSTTGHLLVDAVDANSDGMLDLVRDEINLVGVTDFTATIV